MQREFKISLSQEFYSDTVYLSQYDSDYDLIFHVYDKYALVSVDGMTARLQGQRTDGLGFTFTATASGTDVTFAIDTTISAVAGTHTGEIVFYDANGLYFGSANIQIVVETAAQPDGTIDADTQTARTIQQEVQEIVDTAAATVTASVTELEGEVDTNTANIATNTTAIGTLANLTTDANTDLVSAINEVDAHADTNAAAISSLNADLTSITNISKQTFVVGRYINTSGSTVDTSSSVELSTYAYSVVPCTSGDKFTITGLGGASARLWCFIDSSGNVLMVSTSGYNAQNEIITAPYNSSQLVVNVKIANEYRLFKGVYIAKNLEQTDSNLDVVVSEGLDGVPAHSLTFEQGNLDHSTSGGEVASTIRIRSEKVYAKAGSTFAVGTGYKFTVYTWETDGTTYHGHNAAWVTSYTYSRDCYTRIVMAKTNDTLSIAPNDFNSANASGVFLKYDLALLGDAKELFTETKDLSSLSVTGAYMTDAGSVGDEITLVPTAQASWYYLVTECKLGDKYTVSAIGGANRRAWCFINASNEIVSISAGGVTVNNLELTAPADGKLIVNHNSSTTPPTIVRTRILTAPDINKTQTVTLTDYTWGIIPNGASIGDLVDVTVNTQVSGRYCLFRRCKQGDVFTFNGRAYSSSALRIFCFVDTNMYCTEVAYGERYYQDYSVTAKVDGWIICNFAISSGMTISITSVFEPSTLAQDLCELASEVNATPPVLLMPTAIPTARPTITSLDYDLTSALSLTDYYAGFAALETNYPDYVSSSVLGTDQSGTYTIYQYEFKPSLCRMGGDPVSAHGTAYTADDYPTVVIGCNIHGFEQPICFALLNVFTKICASQSKDDIFGWLRNNIRFIVIPSINPWGYVNDTRGNSRGVDINRNFPVYWDGGVSDPTAIDYRGTSPVSEAETVIYKSVIDEFADTALAFIDLHTLGVFTGYDAMTSFVFTNVHADKCQLAGYATVKEVTYDAWENHNLPTDSGFIGGLEAENRYLMGKCMLYASSLGAVGVTAEGLYRYYDPDHTGSTAVYNTDTNSANAEYLTCTLKNLIYQLTH